MAFTVQKRILKLPLEHNLGSAVCVCARVHVRISKQAGKNGSDKVSSLRHLIWWLIHETKWVRS